MKKSKTFYGLKKKGYDAYAPVQPGDIISVKGYNNLRLKVVFLKLSDYYEYSICAVYALQYLLRSDHSFSSGQYYILYCCFLNQNIGLLKLYSKMQNKGYEQHNLYFYEIRVFTNLTLYLGQNENIYYII